MPTLKSLDRPFRSRTATVLVLGFAALPAFTGHALARSEKANGNSGGNQVPTGTRCEMGPQRAPAPVP